MKMLSIGSVVKLKNGERKIMITSRTPITNDNGTIGYFDYGACLYPNGQINQQTYFFNTEDIVKVYFEGYCDEMEMEFRKQYQKQIGNIKYPKLQINVPQE